MGGIHLIMEYGIFHYGIPSNMDGIHLIKNLFQENDFLILVFPRLTIKEIYTIFVGGELIRISLLLYWPWFSKCDFHQDAKDSNCINVMD